MPGTDFDLGKLLAPVGEAAFFRDYWEKQPLLLTRNDPGSYAGLFSMADVDPVIAFTRPKFAGLGDAAPDAPRQKTFVQGWLADRQLPESASYPAIPELHRLYGQGKTVIIMTMQQRWPPIALLCRNLEAVFHCPVHANLYLTPRGAQGFDAHFDTHEVLVLQLEGHKTWRLYGPGRSLPLVGERYQVARDELGPPREMRLGPGDLLYVPRGHIHEAFTAECASLHLTVGINVFRWADLLHQALADLTRADERFRESLPPGALGGPDVPASVAVRFRELLDVLGQQARAADAVRRLGDEFFGGLQPLPGAHFASPKGEEDLDLDTVLARRPGMVCRVVEERAWAAIEFPGGRVGGPLKIAPALRFIAGTERFAIGALPDDLGPGGKLVLARRLLRERLLAIADRVASGAARATVEVSGIGT